MKARRRARAASLLAAAALLVALSACGRHEQETAATTPLAAAAAAQATTATPTPSPAASPAPNGLTAEQRARYSLLPHVEPDPDWCAPVVSAVVVGRQVVSSMPPLTQAQRNGFDRDMNALATLDGLPAALQQYMADPTPEFDTGFVFLWSAYEAFGQRLCPATEAYKAAHASGPVERHGGFGFQPYAIPSTASPDGS